MKNYVRVVLLPEGGRGDAVTRDGDGRCWGDCCWLLVAGCRLSGMKMIRQFVVLALAGAQVAAAQIPSASSRLGVTRSRSAIDSGVVVAFGGRTPVTDFGPFHQIPAFHYLTNFRRAGRGVRDGRASRCRNRRRCS